MGPSRDVTRILVVALASAMASAGITLLVLMIRAMVSANVGYCGTGGTALGAPCPKGSGWTSYLGLPLIIAALPIYGLGMGALLAALVAQ